MRPWAVLSPSAWMSLTKISRPASFWPPSTMPNPCDRASPRRVLAGRTDRKQNDAESEVYGGRARNKAGVASCTGTLLPQPPRVNDGHQPDDNAGTRGKTEAKKEPLRQPAANLINHTARRMSATAQSRAAPARF